MGPTGSRHPYVLNPGDFVVCEEGFDAAGDFFAVGLESKMPGIDRISRSEPGSLGPGWLNLSVGFVAAGGNYSEIDFAKDDELVWRLSG